MQDRIIVVGLILIGLLIGAFAGSERERPRRRKIAGPPGPCDCTESEQKACRVWHKPKGTK